MSPPDVHLPDLWPLRVAGAVLWLLFLRESRRASDRLSRGFRERIGRLRLQLTDEPPPAPPKSPPVEAEDPTRCRST